MHQRIDEGANMALAIQHGRSEAILKMAEALGVPPYWKRFIVDVSYDGVVTVDCEYAVSAEKGVQILTGKYRLEKIQ